MQRITFREIAILLFFCLAIPVAAQEPPPPMNQGTPTVPIDGGLTALLVAGGAMGYRAMKKKKEEL